MRSGAITHSLAEVPGSVYAHGPAGTDGPGELCQELKSESQRWPGASVTLTPKLLFLCQVPKSAAQNHI